MSERYSFDCGLCGYHRRLEGKARLYDTPERINVLEWPCWCWSCDAVSLAELVPGLEAIVAEGKAWKRRDRKFKYLLHYIPSGVESYDDGRDPYAIAYFDALFAWRKERRSPARCLYCGTQWIGLVRDRHCKFEHPRCGGMISYSFSFSSVCNAEAPLAEIFSTEGLKLYETRDCW